MKMGYGHQMLSCCLAFFSCLAVADVHDVFSCPPAEAKLQMWYHWIADCVTEEGIVADMRAMGELGVGTAHIFAPSMGDLPVKAKPMDGEWLRLFSVAIREAKRNGFTLGFHNCPGWSSSGGPWITPENSMKKVVWSETDVMILGRDVYVATGKVGVIRLSRPKFKLGFYRDIAVYAIPRGQNATFAPEVKTPDFPKALGTKEPGTTASLDFDYAFAWQPRFFAFRTEHDRITGCLAVSAKYGNGWTEVAKVQLSPWAVVTDDRVIQLKLGRPARKFRVTFTSAAFPGWMGQHDTVISSASFNDMPLIENVTDKNSSTCTYMRHRATGTAVSGVPMDSILDLTDALRPDGILDLETVLSRLRSSSYRILRIGYTTTGAKPAPATISGLECDKLDRKGIETHWAAMPAKILALPGAKETVSHCIIDSYEVGGQNWTECLPDEFAKRRGYPIGKRLVAVCGYAVGSAEESLAFLWDWQRTIGELFAENYYDRFTELCHESGVKSIIEPYGGPFDCFRCGRNADVPTGEFWLGAACGVTPRLAASIAHLGGRAIAAAESFTTDEAEGRWTSVPHKFRVDGDEKGWLNGINQIVFHSYVHQPFMNVKPGLSLGRHGSQFNRNTTWWKEGRLWADYVRRGQALLQYGRPVAEFLVLGGSSADELMERGYNYDLCTEYDLDALEVRDRRIVVGTAHSPNLDATAYNALIIRKDESDFTLEYQMRIAELEKVGAKVYRGLSVGAAAAASGVVSPFDGKGQLQATRRRGLLGETIWFVVNVSDRVYDAEAGFEYDEGTIPERFDAKTGNVNALPFRTVSDKALVALRLNPHESTFVVFSYGDAKFSPQAGESLAVNAMDISFGWTITSFAGPNAPFAPLPLAQLVSWSDSPDSRLKYFSGRAIYEKKIEGFDATGETRTIIDLGEVRDIANVWVGDTFVGTLWEPPYRVDITSALSTNGKPQDTAISLRVEVVNCWPNRMIGDAIARTNNVDEPKVAGKWPKWVIENRPDSRTGIYTWSNWGAAFRPDDPLQRAGIIGPAKLRTSRKCLGDSPRKVP